MVVIGEHGALKQKNRVGEAWLPSVGPFLAAKMLLDPKMLAAPLAGSINAPAAEEANAGEPSTKQAGHARRSFLS